MFSCFLILCIQWFCKNSSYALTLISIFTYSKGTDLYNSVDVISMLCSMPAMKGVKMLLKV